jgi:hypothetical protein
LLFGAGHFFLLQYRILDLTGLALHSKLTYDSSKWGQKYEYRNFRTHSSAVSM